MIDLDRFSAKTLATVPIVNGKGQVKSRTFNSRVVNGWYVVELGDDVVVKERATPMQIDSLHHGKRKFKGIPLGRQFFPINFNNLELLGMDQTERIYLNQADEWDVIKAVLWDDGKIYFLSVDYGFKRLPIDQVREAFEKEQPITGIKDLTPEIRYYFLVVSLHRDGIRQAIELQKMKLAEADKIKRMMEFRKTFAGRLDKTVSDAGGKLIRFYQRGDDRYMVEWKVGGEKLKTLIKDDLRIIDLGFCASEEDGLHSLGSAVNLAKVYVEEGGIGDGGLYVTRS